MSETAPEGTRPAAAPSTQRRGGGGLMGTFATRIGPLPMYAWLLIITGILIAWRVYSNKQTANQAASQTGSTSAPDVPQFVNQTYTTVTAPQQGPPEPPEPPEPGAPGHNPPTPLPLPRPAPRPQPVSGKAPAMPGVIRPGRATGSSIAFSWPKVAGATSYLIRITYQDKLVKQETTTRPSATVSGLSPDHTYTVHVASVGKGGTSSETNGPAMKTLR